MYHLQNFIQNKLVAKCCGFVEEYCHLTNTLSTEKTDYYWKKLSQSNSAVVMVALCLKWVKNFIFEFLTSENFFSESKTFKSIYMLWYFASFSSYACVDKIVNNWTNSTGLQSFGPPFF